MLKLRTKLLLFAIAVFDIGIGVLAGIGDGAYSAIGLFVFHCYPQTLETSWFSGDLRDSCEKRNLLGRA